MGERHLNRFLSYVTKNPETGCWMWGGRVRKGYGLFGTEKYAHRYAYSMLVGPIPAGLELDHLCLTPLCVNPAHLEPVTRAENMRRRVALQTHCKNGHLFDEANTYIPPDRKGWTRRSCRRCNRAAVARYQRRRDRVTS
jgi:hypothetical protein